MSGPHPVPHYRGDFAQETKHLESTPDFNTRLEAIMRDPLATIGERYLAWIKRNSWGRGEFYAVKPDGTPAWQRDAVKDLNIDKRRISAATNYFVKRGYLREELKILYLVVSPSLGPDPQKVRDVPDFFITFQQEWKVQNGADFSEYEKALETRKVLDVIIKRVRLKMQPAFKKWLRERTLAQKDQTGTDESNPSGPPVLVPTSIEEVGRYVQGPESGLSTYLPTDSNSQPEHKPLSVEERILELPAVKAVERQLKDTLRQPLLGKIAAKLNGAPPDRLNERIHLRFAKIKSFGVLVNFAQDVREIWEAEQATRESEQQERRRREVDALRAIAADLEEPEDVRADARRKLELLE